MSSAVVVAVVVALDVASAHPNFVGAKFKSRVEKMFLWAVVNFCVTATRVMNGALQQWRNSDYAARKYRAAKSILTRQFFSDH